MEKEATALLDALEARHPRPVVRPAATASATVSAGA
jgi:biopolymer transport protein ExbB